MSARSESRCELTDTSSPAAIDSAPATSPATPAVTIAAPDAPDAATPRTRLAVETIPSLAPRTAARSQLERWLRWTGPVARSGEVCGGDEITVQGGDEGVDLVLHAVPLHALGFHADLIALRGEAAIKRRGRGVRHDAFT